MSELETDLAETRRRWKLAIYASYGVGALAIVVGVVVERQLAGAIAYLLGIVLGTAFWAIARFYSPVLLYDERDLRAERRASHRAILTTAAVGLAVFPVLFVLDAAGYYEIQPPLEGALYAVSALFLLWGVLYVVDRVRP